MPRIRSRDLPRDPIISKAPFLAQKLELACYKRGPFAGNLTAHPADGFEVREDSPLRASIEIAGARHDLGSGEIELLL